MDKQFSHEELQRDEVADSMAKAVDSLRRHRHLLVGALVLAVVAIIGNAAWRSSRDQKAQESSNLMIEVLNRYNTFESQTVPEDRKRDFDGAMAAIASLQTEYPNTDLANLAEFIKGRLAFSDNKFDAAAVSFKKCLEYAKTPDQKAQAEIALGYNDENSSFLVADDAQRRPLIDSAMKHYQNAVGLVPAENYLNYYAQLGVARLYELLNENQKALDLLKNLVAHQPLPGPATKAQDLKPTEDPIGDSLRAAIVNYQDQIRLGATAELRLKRLEAKMGIEETVETTTAAGEAPKTETPEAPKPAAAQ